MSLQNSKLTIFTDGHVTPLFVKANRNLIYQNFEEIKTIDDIETLRLKLAEYWKTHYESQLIFDSSIGSWTEIQFDTYQKMMMFVLKYSN